MEFLAKSERVPLTRTRRRKSSGHPVVDAFLLHFPSQSGLNTIIIMWWPGGGCGRRHEKGEEKSQGNAKRMAMM